MALAISSIKRRAASVNLLNSDVAGTISSNGQVLHVVCTVTANSGGTFTGAQLGLADIEGFVPGQANVTCVLATDTVTIPNTTGTYSFIVWGTDALARSNS